MNLNNPSPPAGNTLDAVIEHSEMQKDGNSFTASFACNMGVYVMRVRGNMGVETCSISWYIDGEYICDTIWTTSYCTMLANVVVKIPVVIGQSGEHVLKATYTRNIEINRVWFKKQ